MIYEKVTVTVKGMYYRYLFRDNTFSGDIKVSNDNVTQNGQLNKVTFFKQGYNIGSLNYYNNSFIYGGNIVVKGNFESILIMKPIYNAEENPYIVVGPANSIDIAVEIGKQILPEYELQ